MEPKSNQESKIELSVLGAHKMLSFSWRKETKANSVINKNDNTADKPKLVRQITQQELEAAREAYKLAWLNVGPRNIR